MFSIATSISGLTKGVVGQTNSTTGTGVEGVSAYLAGVTSGVKGVSVSATGTGMYGVAAGPTGPDVNYGVRGLNMGRLGIGVYCEGRFGVKHTSVATVTPWPARIENDTHAQHQGGMPVSDGGFLDMNNNALVASPNFARLDSGGNWTIVSDRRRKRDIHPLSGTLDKAMALEPVNLRFKEDAGTTDEEQIGFIAQDVPKQSPSLVTNGKLLTLNYAGPSVVAIAAIQEQLRVIERLTREIADRDTEVGELRNRLSRLERLLSARLADVR